MNFDNESFNHTLNKPKLRVGIIKNIGDIVTLERKSLEAYNTAKEAFYDDGHELVEFEFKQLFEFTMNGVNILNNEALPLIMDEMLEKGDPLDPNIQTVLFMYNVMPKFVMKILATISSLFMPRVFSGLLRMMHPVKIDELIGLNKTKTNRIQEFADQYYSLKLDILLIPGYHTPAFKMEDRANHDLPPLHFILFNILHFPVGTVPVLPKDKSLPVGVQIASAQWQDEKCLAGMKRLETLLSK